MISETEGIKMFVTGCNNLFWLGFGMCFAVLKVRGQASNFKHVAWGLSPVSQIPIKNQDL